ncbi:MAG TPA: hypothetical protein VN282_25105 [Pyrinomonadaceae bacterium]|nr:hypothetical protein [Pyrinomonadaceae bacterium]
MPRKRTPLCLAALLLFALAHAPRGARAQTSHINVPTGEVMPEGESYLEFSLDTRPLGRRDGGFQTYGVFFVHGARRGVEVGVNAYFTKDWQESEPVELQSNVKFRLYESEERGVSVGAGGILYAPTGRAGGDTLGMAYSTVTKSVPALGGARLTGGGYALVGQRRGSGQNAGALLAYEQPLHRRLSFIADWNTGRNRFGYSAAGLSLSLPKRGTLTSAYYFGNEGRGNNYLGVYYGLSF